VADLFLPSWLAERIFPVCGTLFAIALVLIGARILSRIALLRSFSTP
jgi:hypothetical protein